MKKIAGSAGLHIREVNNFKRDRLPKPGVVTVVMERLGCVKVLISNGFTFS